MLYSKVCTPPTITIVNKVHSRNKVLKSLAGSTWSNIKGNRPAINYAAPILSPGCSRTHMEEIKTCQNTALSKYIGMSPIEHLHSEDRMLLVKEHKKLLSRQFMLGFFSQKPSIVATTTTPFATLSDGCRTMVLFGDSTVG